GSHSFVPSNTGARTSPASAERRVRASAACGGDDAHPRKLPCRLDTAAGWPAVFPPARVTTSAAARLRHVYRAPPRETSSCRYRYRSRRFQNCGVVTGVAARRRGSTDQKATTRYSNGSRGRGYRVELLKLDLPTHETPYRWS